ncbi:hypothetical protein QJS04_geneDACA014234 [Acorus gramineus]|uniref:Uncharacterized protein n=1 Tax=Acorus gramineus TaxID=55184 RepID=A0AAV9BYB2_ACOGR|nr:hypothetical protein QJS04_geneDACA014234 [Acorus gramineus]
METLTEIFKGFEKVRVYRIRVKVKIIGTMSQFDISHRIVMIISYYDEHLIIRFVKI